MVLRFVVRIFLDLIKIFRSLQSFAPSDWPTVQFSNELVQGTWKQILKKECNQKIRGRKEIKTKIKKNSIVPIIIGNGGSAKNKKAK